MRSERLEQCDWPGLSTAVSQRLGCHATRRSMPTCGHDNSGISTMLLLKWFGSEAALDRRRAYST